MAVCFLTRRFLTCSSRNTTPFKSYRLETFTRWSSTSTSRQEHAIQVPVGGNGSVEIEVLPSLTPSVGTQQSLLIYLPSGPFNGADAELSTSSTKPVSQILSELLPRSHILTIKYRLGPPNHLFPLPIHDTYLGFDHIRQQIAPNICDKAQSSLPPLISVYGSHIGGSLALSLALTEPTRLRFVAAALPITNWIDLEESDISSIISSAKKDQRSKTGRKTSTLLAADPTAAAVKLRNLRSTLFPKPETYFDPFASPSLFLRSPGRDCPPPIGSFDNYLDISDDPSPTSPPPRRRKVLRRWPPFSSSSTFGPSRYGPSATDEEPDSLLPFTRILTPSLDILEESLGGTQMILRHQGKEMVDLMKRGCFWGRAESRGADERVTLEEVEQRSLGSQVESDFMAMKAGEWLRGNLEDVSNQISPRL